MTPGGSKGTRGLRQARVIGKRAGSPAKSLSALRAHQVAKTRASSTPVIGTGFAITSSAPADNAASRSTRGRPVSVEGDYRDVAPIAGRARSAAQKHQVSRHVGQAKVQQDYEIGPFFLPGVSGEHRIKAPLPVRGQNTGS